MLAADHRQHCVTGLLGAQSGGCFSALAALERWLQGQGDGVGPGAQGIPVLLYKPPGLSPVPSTSS